MVSKCRLVVFHSSTSVGYAVLSRKPVISVKVPGLPVGSPVNLFVDTLANNLGVKPINLLANRSILPSLRIEIDEKNTMNMSEPILDQIAQAS